MDGDRYRQPGVPQYPSYTGPQNQLPPLQFNPGYGNPQTTQPGTPVTSATSSMPPLQHAPLRPLQPQPHPSYSAMTTSYMQGSILPTAGGLANPQSLQPASAMGMAPSLYNHPPMHPNQEPEPVHVVGQQGRRGVLPTHPGRPAPSSARAPATVTKNAAGKFECAHCNKTYLHMKHLKRHLLRHTGERPYQCHLCKDTFSRSDILKRHFQKCSIRRGNPTGANHLHHAQHHLQKDRQPAVSEQNTYLGQVGGTSMPYADAGYTMAMPQPPPPGSSSYSETVPSNPSHQSMSARTSRSNSIIRPTSGIEESRRSIAGMMSFNDYRTDAVPNGYGQQPGQHPVSLPDASSHYAYDHGAAVGGALGPNNGPVKTEGLEAASYGVPSLPGAEGIPNGQDGSLWRSGSFNSESHIMNSSTTSDDASDESLFGIFSHNTGLEESYSMLENWFLTQATPDPLDQLAHSLVTFCYPNEPSSPDTDSHHADVYTALKGILTPDNIKTFLHEYRHYHAHWPLHHLPSFDPYTADPGLVLALCCVGSIYTDRVSAEDSRWLVETVRSRILGQSLIYQAVLNPSSEYDWNDDVARTSEELLCLALLHCLFLWHGTPRQRQTALDEYWAVAESARRAGLQDPLPSGHPLYSALHQPGPITGEEVDSWIWQTWIQNEKRTRALSFIYLLDACAIMYLNSAPQFDFTDFRIPFAADDAAWEARTAEDCARALGLRGEAAQVKNISGSRRPKQLIMSEALEVLHGDGKFPERATNVFGKFMLIHAIILQVCDVQRQLLLHVPSSRRAIPQSLASSPSTPTRSSNEEAQQLRRQTIVALENWKTGWDTDLVIQFTQDERRTGFCRDGIHFYFMTQMFLRNSRPEEWAAPPDLRCQRTFHLLKRIRAYVASDAIQKGIDIGSVTQIADDYGITDLTLDMKRLFTPIEQGQEKSLDKACRSFP